MSQAMLDVIIVWTVGLGAMGAGLLSFAHWREARKAKRPAAHARVPAE